MKKVLLLVILLVGCLSVRAESPTKILFKQAMDANKLAVDSGRKGNYDVGIKAITDFLKIYNSQPKAVRDSVKYLEANRQFTLSLLYANKKETEKATKALIAALNTGYNNYNTIKNEDVLSEIRNDEKVKILLEPLRIEQDYLTILQRAAGYNNDSIPLQFTYMNSNDSNLVRIRNYFNLDSVVGTGDELLQIKRLLTFVHDLIPHDGNHPNQEAKDIIEMVQKCKSIGAGANCRGLAIVLNECYLAMGFKSRFVTCMPKVYISDCHVINAVWSKTLNKWLWVDPTNDAYITDENGVMLSIEEVRERLRTGKPLQLNDYANWNHKSKVKKEYYLESYMAKNLFYYNCADRFEYNTEKTGKAKYIQLVPVGYTPNYMRDAKDTVISNPHLFWQAPQ